MRRSDLLAYVLGVALIGIGLVLLLNNIGAVSVDFRDIIRDYWPVLIVALGLFWVFSPDKTESEKWEEVEGQGDEADQSEPGHEDPDASGVEHERELAKRRINVGWVIAIMGLLILGSSTGRWALNGSHAGGICWAIAAVLIGLVMARSSVEPGQEGRASWAVLSRIEHTQPGWEVRSSSYSAVLGNILLDLSVAGIPDAETYLDITAVLGGVQVILPPELPVRCEGTAILGSVNAFGHTAGGGLVSRDFVRHGSDDSKSSLRIRCRTILGSIDIR